MMHTIKKVTKKNHARRLQVSTVENENMDRQKSQQ